MEIETRFVLKRSPRGEIIRVLPMVLPVDATIADVLAKAEFNLDGQSVWMNGKQADINSKIRAQLTVTVFLEPDNTDFDLTLPHGAWHAPAHAGG